jgi:hypothetical protein
VSQLEADCTEQKRLEAEATGGQGSNLSCSAIAWMDEMGSVTFAITVVWSDHYTEKTNLQPSTLSRIHHVGITMNNCLFLTLAVWL